MELYRIWNGTNLQEEIETHHVCVDDQRIMIAEHILTTNNNQFTKGIIYRYQYSNHLGSVGLECDGSGSIISYEEYHPCRTTAYQAKNAAIATTAKRYRYTGMERDEESGMAYHSARYYLNWLGRWLSSDPIGIEDGGNGYCYCKGNPISLIDRNGKEGEGDRTLLYVINHVIDTNKDEIVSFEKFGELSVKYKDSKLADGKGYENFWIDNTLKYGSGTYTLDDLLGVTVKKWRS